MTKEKNKGLTIRYISEDAHKVIKAQAKENKQTIHVYLSKIARDITAGKYDHMTSPLIDRPKAVKVGTIDGKEAQKHLEGTQDTFISLLEKIVLNKEG